jgi:hypothetical protein
LLRTAFNQTWVGTADEHKVLDLLEANGSSEAQIRGHLQFNPLT